MEPSANDVQPTSSLQRLAIAAGVLIIVVLTVVAALFLAMEDLPEGEEPTALVQVTPTTPIPPTATPSPSPSATAEPPAPTPSPSPTSPGPEEPTVTPSATATATNSPEPTPAPPTPTQMVVVVTATPPPGTPAQPGPATPPPAEGVCQPPPTWVSYQVQVGDTLNSLAERTGSTVFELQQVNCLESFTIQPGQTVYLPFIPPTPTITPTASATARPGPTPTRTATPISPQIDSVTPNRVDREAADEEVTITILGRNFRPREQGFRVDLRGPASVQLQVGPGGTSTSFETIVPPGLPLGSYDLVVTNSDGRAGTRQSVYTIGPPRPTDTPAPAPDVIRFTPTSGLISEEIVLTVQGRDFQADQTGFRVELQSISSSFNVELELGEVRTDTNFTAIIPPDSLERGDYNLVVTNPDGRSDIASDRYRAIE